MDCPDTVWESLPPMACARMYGSAIFFNEQIYVFGGCSMLGAPLCECEVYNFKNKSWRSLKDMPQRRVGCAVVGFNNTLLLIGGYNEKNRPIADVVSFDCVSENWNFHHPELKSECLMHPCVVETNGNVFVIGGGDAHGRCIDLCSLLEKNGNDWKDLPPIPNKRYAAKGYVHEGKIYVFGGRSGMEAVSSVDVFDLETQSWEKTIDNPEFPDRRVFPAIVRNEGNVFILGGLKGTHDFQQTVECFDMNTREWTKREPLPFPRADMAVGIVKDYLIVTAGICEYGPNQVTELYNFQTQRWHTLSDMPTPRFSTASVVNTNEMIIVIGGLGLKGHSKEAAALIVKNN